MPPFLKDSYTNFSLKKLILYLLAISMLASCHNIRSGKEVRNSAVSQHDSTQSNFKSASGSQTGRLTIVNWNIEWLGSKRNGPKNKKQQLAGAVKILQYLHADIYGLCEIVDLSALKTLTTSLGKDYQYVISDYASGVRTKSGRGYEEAQKLAYIYNTKVFSKLKAGPLLAENARAGYYFANGRYPYELSARMTLNGVSENINLLLIHAKSGADKSSYARRLQAATLLKSKLDADYKEQPLIMMGDFNDEVHESITSGEPSPYTAFLQDPHYNTLTWAATMAKENSTLDFPTVIDQQIISAALNKYYIRGSTKIRKDVVKIVPDFLRGSTSDHYPVSSQFLLTTASQSQPPLLSKVVQPANGSGSHAKSGSSTISASPSSSSSHDDKTASKAKTDVFAATLAEKSIEIRPTEKVQNIQFVLYNARNNKVLSVHRKYILKDDLFVLRTPKLYAGDYSLVIYSDLGSQVIDLHQP